jgi:hypothetical protein
LLRKFLDHVSQEKLSHEAAERKTRDEALGGGLASPSVIQVHGLRPTGINYVELAELADVERHRRVPAGAFDPVVLDLERDAALVGCSRLSIRMISDDSLLTMVRSFLSHRMGTVTSPV